ncbi:MAG: hypothetical protein ABI167_00865 [Nitrosospira sp.]
MTAKKKEANFNWTLLERPWHYYWGHIRCNVYRNWVLVIQAIRAVVVLAESVYSYVFCRGKVETIQAIDKTGATSSLRETEIYAVFCMGWHG